MLSPSPWRSAFDRVGFFGTILRRRGLWVATEKTRFARSCRGNAPRSDRLRIRSRCARQTPRFGGVAQADSVWFGHEGVVAEVVGATDVVEPRESAVVEWESPVEEVEHVGAAPVQECGRGRQYAARTALQTSGAVPARRCFCARWLHELAGAGMEDGVGVWRDGLGEGVFEHELC